jgi:hypothetical protein
MRVDRSYLFGRREFLRTAAAGVAAATSATGPRAQARATGARDYYVSPGGDDAADGTQAGPWRSIARVNAQAFQPGDRILFEGGEAFAGTLELKEADSGVPGSEVVVTTWGSERAIIDGGGAPAILADGCRHVAIRNLTLRGAGRKTGNTGSGLVVTGAESVEIEGIEVFGFRRSGIELSGVRNARVTHVYAHQNGFAGISSGGEVSSNLYFAFCLLENNPGDPTIRANHSGNGIVIGMAEGAVIEYCEARYNGWDQPWTGNGPVGIWAYRSDNVVIQFCVAHHNRSTAHDGGGFDFDGGMTNSILQYNYSHSNFGCGYLICQYEDAGRFADNIVRYNISQDDGLKDHDAGIFVWVGGAEMVSTLVHNNTIFNTKGAAVAFGVSSRYADQLPTITFHNNIFVSQGPQIRGGSEKGRFIGNQYWSMGERGFNVDEYKDFAEWVAATGQETHEGNVVGLFADPLLRKDGNGLLTDPLKLATLREYRLLPGSPAIDAGLDLRGDFGLDPGKRDYYGTPLPANGGLDMGAHEFVDPSPRRWDR